MASYKHNFGCEQTEDEHATVFYNVFLTFVLYRQPCNLYLFSAVFGKRYPVCNVSAEMKLLYSRKLGANTFIILMPPLLYIFVRFGTYFLVLLFRLVRRGNIHFFVYFCRKTSYLPTVCRFDNGIIKMASGDGADRDKVVNYVNYLLVFCFFVLSFLFLPLDTEGIFTSNNTVIVQLRLCLHLRQSLCCRFRHF